MAAESILKAFQEDPQAWMKVDAILEQAKLEQTKFFGLQVRQAAASGPRDWLARLFCARKLRCNRQVWAFAWQVAWQVKCSSAVERAAAPPLPTPRCTQILEATIKFKWGALPVEQREGIKTYVSNLIIKYSTDDALFRTQATFLRKLNVILVQVGTGGTRARWGTHTERDATPDAWRPSKRKPAPRHAWFRAPLASTDPRPWLRLRRARAAPWPTMCCVGPVLPAASPRARARGRSSSRIGRPSGRPSCQT